MNTCIRFLSTLIVLFITTAPLRAQWVQTGGPKGGEVTALGLFQNGAGGTLLLAGADKNIYASADNGKHWTCPASRLNVLVFAFAASPNATGGVNLFAGTDIGFYRSTTNGVSWEPANDGLPDYVHQLGWITALVASPDGQGGATLFAGTTNSGIYRSADNGTHWTAAASGLPPGGYISSLVGLPGASGGMTLFAGTGSEGVYRSENTGTDWMPANAGMKTLPIKALTVGGANLYAMSADSLYFSSDGGNSWTKANAALPKGATSLVATPDGAGGAELFVGTTAEYGGDGIFRSTDNGAHWTAVNFGLTNHQVSTFAVHTDEAGRTNIYAGARGSRLGFSAGGIFQSADNGEHWVAVNAGWTNTNIPSLKAVPDNHGGVTLFAGTSGNGIFHSADNGASWTQAITELTDVYVYAFAVHGEDLFAGAVGGVIHSADNGITWNRVNTGLTDTMVYALAVHGEDLFAGTERGAFRSSDNGAHWAAIDSGIANSDHVPFSVRTLSFFGTDLFAGTSDGIYRSSNNGASWVAVNDGLVVPSGERPYIQTLTSDSTNLYAVANGTIYRSTGNGTSWEALPGIPMSFAGVSTLFVHGKYLFAFTGPSPNMMMYLFLSTDHGQKWTLTEAGFSIYQLAGSFAASETDLFTGTWGGGVWRRPLSEMITSVRREDQEEAPTRFAIGQNYPNPFNPSTTFTFSLPSRSFVTLKIYDVLGREISTIVAEDVPAGTYTHQWSASEDTPSGVYFYRLQAGSLTETRRLVLLR